MTRTTVSENATEETKEDEFSSSYVSTDVVKGNKNKDFGVNGVDDVDNNDNRVTNYLSSSIKKKNGKKNTKRGGGGVVNKRQEGYG